MKMHAMIDIETLGRAPNGVIATIGAAKFAWENGTAHSGETFYRRLNMHTQQADGFSFDADTIHWWLGQSDAAKSELLSIHRDPHWVVLKDLRNFLSDVDTVWAHGTTFDITILESAYARVFSNRVFSEEPTLWPWPYRAIRDARTVYALAGVKVDKTGIVAHHALDDCHAQIKALTAAFTILGVKSL